MKSKYSFLTGSNGKLLSGELATHLSGKYVSFRIMPFSFREICEIKGLYSTVVDILSAEMYIE